MYFPTECVKEIQCSNHVEAYMYRKSTFLYMSAWINLKNETSYARATSLTARTVWQRNDF